METIFSTPMRTNNDNSYLSGDVRLGDIMDFALYGTIKVKIGIASIRAGDSILVSVKLLDGTREFFKYDSLITDDANDFYLGFTSGEITADTFINGSIHTNGQARYSIDIVALEPSEDFPGEPHF